MSTFYTVRNRSRVNAGPGGAGLKSRRKTGPARSRRSAAPQELTSAEIGPAQMVGALGAAPSGDVTETERSRCLVVVLVEMTHLSGRDGGTAELDAIHSLAGP